MGINFFRWLAPKTGRTARVDVTCQELQEAALDFQFRQLSFWSCVNLIANAIGRCEIRTFRDGEEIRGGEYYAWNVEPNPTQSSSAFWHKLVGKLYSENEALILCQENQTAAGDAFYVADDWTEVEPSDPFGKPTYRDVTINDKRLPKIYQEDEVLHLRLNHKDMKPVTDGIYASYWRLVKAAMDHYAWTNGQHWKVHVNEIASSVEGFEDGFKAMIEKQIKPFLTSSTAVLPEFDGYTYTREDGGGTSDTRDIKAMMDDIFDFTARGMLVPVVLVNGKVEATSDAQQRMLTSCIDPLCDQIQEEINRKRYRYPAWKTGNFVRVDSSSIIHFDLFANASNIEKIVGSAAFSVNDILRAANQPTINEPWADEHFLTKNISTMDDVANRLGIGKGDQT